MNQHSSKGSILFYDIQSSGHHKEYLQHIINHDAPDTPCYICVNSNLYPEFSNCSNKTIIQIPDHLTGRPADELRWIRSICTSQVISSVFLLNIDPYIKFIRTLRNSGISISGIFFHPPHRITIPSGSTLRTSLSLLYKKIYGYYLMHLAQRYGIIKVLFILDDRWGARYLDKRYKYQVRNLPDPVLPLKINNHGSDGVKDPANSQILLFGSIFPRKNIEKLFIAVKEQKITNCTINIVGKGDPAYVDKLKSISADLPVHVNIINRFVDLAEMAQWFSTTDIVLMVYKNFFGASGVLGYAAYFNKPVICSTGGLVEYLVTKYHLGRCIDQGYHALKEALANCVQYKPSSYNKVFLKNKTPENYCSNLFRLV